MPQFQITHTTDYTFDELVEDVGLECTLLPLEYPFQHVDYHKLLFQPHVTRRTKHKDKFDNHKQRAWFSRQLQRISVSASSKVTMSGRQPTQSESLVTEEREHWATLYDRDELAALNSFTNLIAHRLFAAHHSTEQKLQALNRYVFEHFTYDVTATETETSVVEVLRNKKGVCQDFSRLMIAVLQLSGIPARYVSGYAYWLQGNKDIITESASHAWVSAYVEGSGWVDYDPTNNKKVDDCYITLATGRDYVDVIPVNGLVPKATPHRIKVSVTIEKLRE